MKVHYLLHQTSIENIQSILTTGLRPTLKSRRIVEDEGDFERFIWFDFIGETGDDIIYSNTGHNTAENKGVTLVLDFHEILKQVKTGEEEFFVRFVSDYIRFESNTDSITTWSSADIPYPRTNPELPNEIARSIECVISTDETDKTLNMYLGDYQSDRNPIYFNVLGCISKIVVCEQHANQLRYLLRKLGIYIEVVVHKEFSKEQKDAIQLLCKNKSMSKTEVRRACDMLYVQSFISNCM